MLITNINGCCLDWMVRSLQSFIESTSKNCQTSLSLLLSPHPYHFFMTLNVFLGHKVCQYSLLSLSIVCPSMAWSHDVLQAVIGKNWRKIQAQSTFRGNSLVICFSTSILDKIGKIQVAILKQILNSLEQMSLRIFTKAANLNLGVVTCLVVHVDLLKP